MKNILHATILGSIFSLVGCASNGMQPYSNMPNGNREINSPPPQNILISNQKFNDYISPEDRRKGKTHLEWYEPNAPSGVGMPN